MSTTTHGRPNRPGSGETSAVLDEFVGMLHGVRDVPVVPLDLARVRGPPTHGLQVSVAISRRTSQAEEE